MAVILIGIAAYFLWQGSGDSAFVSAVLGAVSFFLSIRFQVKGRLKEREIEEEARRKEENARTNLLAEDLDSTEQFSERRATSDGQRTSL